MNYFEFYGIPVSFLVDEAQVIDTYIELSRKYHPDFYAAETDMKQQEALRLSTLNTHAFQTLSDFDKRMKYVLEIKHLIQEGEKYELPKDFLMQMLEINETLMELKLDPDSAKIMNTESQMHHLLDNLFNEIAESISNYNDANASPEVLQKIKDYYYKKKYLLRIKQSLDTFDDSQ